MPMSHLPVKTQPLFNNDQGHKILGIHQGKFELHKRAAQKRKPPLKPVCVNDDLFCLLLLSLIQFHYPMLKAAKSYNNLLPKLPC